MSLDSDNHPHKDTHKKRSSKSRSNLAPRQQPKQGSILQLQNPTMCHNHRSFSIGSSCSNSSSGSAELDRELNRISLSSSSGDNHYSNDNNKLKRKPQHGGHYDKDSKKLGRPKQKQPRNSSLLAASASSSSYLTPAAAAQLERHRLHQANLQNKSNQTPQQPQHVLPLQQQQQQQQQAVFSQEDAPTFVVTTPDASTLLPPTSTTTTQWVEVEPGYSLPLKGGREMTLKAVRSGFFEELYCPMCDTELMCMADVSHCVCPECDHVSPVEGNLTSLLNRNASPAVGASQHTKRHPHNIQGSVGLGVRSTCFDFEEL